MASAASEQKSSKQASEQSSAVRLRGLPFSASEQDVLAFCAQHNIVERIAEGGDAVRLLEPNGRPSGLCIVRMRQNADAEVAVQALNASGWAVATSRCSLTTVGGRLRPHLPRRPLTMS